MTDGPMHEVLEGLNLPEVVPRETWPSARLDLFEREKAPTRERDALNADRRAAPPCRTPDEYPEL